VTEPVVLIAQYLLFGLVLLAGLAWLTLDRAGKLRMAVAGVLGLAVLGLFIWLAGTLHVDPRPFVQDPSTAPLFPHPADNGFPSDHAAAGGLLTAWCCGTDGCSACWSASAPSSWPPPASSPTCTTCRTWWRGWRWACSPEPSASL
jgi:hypothetical protein